MLALTIISFFGCFYIYVAQKKNANSENLEISFFSFCQIELTDDKLVLGPTPGVLRDVYFPGFPTMKHLPYTAEVKSVGIKVFDMVSRNDSVIIKVTNALAEDEAQGNYDLAAIGASLIGKEIFVGWPHLSEAKVVSVSDENSEFIIGGLRKNDQRRFEMQLRSLSTQ